MYEIRVEAKFSAAHRLREYEGKCENLHGHNWKVEAIVFSENLDRAGMVLDFKVLKAALEEVIKDLDHSYLNDSRYFKEINPTSENIAKYIFDVLKKRGMNPARVSVWESDSSCAAYSE